MDVLDDGTASGQVSLQRQANRRRLMVRDSLTFLTLTAVALVLGGVTTLLFRSFESHREQLAVRWAERGRQALAKGDSKEAVYALRTSLFFRPDERANQLALARALAADGHTVEAENYFLNLWQASPGDGEINLELARLKRQQKQSLGAVQYYRAAVFGNWYGDGAQRRRDVRLELSSYLVGLGQSQAAQAELLLSAGNNPDALSQLRIAEGLAEAGDSRDALAAYRNVLDDKQLAPVAETKIGELCYRVGDYDCAAEHLALALRARKLPASEEARIRSMKEDAGRLSELAVSHDIPSDERAAHLLLDGRIAASSLKTCIAKQAEKVGALTELQAAWKQFDTANKRAQLRHDDDVQDGYRALIFSTEQAVSEQCGPLSGDDALLLYLSGHSETRLGGKF